MMHRLIPYGIQQYLPDEVAKPIIELCSFFKQICSVTLMEDDILKAQSKVVDILCNLKIIYPPALFDIMIHLVIHLPLEALEGGPIRPRWMFPFERLIKKLKGYVRNKAKLEGSIAEDYIVEEAMTIVFRLLCKSINLRSVIRFDAQELKKVIWYVLHNSPEIDTYRSQLKSKFLNKDMKEEFPDCESFALACGPTPAPISVNSCVVNGVRFVVHSRDKRRTTQNNDICSPGGKDGEMYYGQLQEILEFLYFSFKVVLFRVKWFDTTNEGRKVKHLVLRNNMTQILTKEEDPDVIHFNNSSDLPLSTSLNDLDNATLHIDGQSTEVDAVPDIIDLDKDDDIIDDGDFFPHDLVDSDDEYLVNVDDDDRVDMLANVAKVHGGDGDGDDRPHTHYIPTGWGVASRTEHLQKLYNPSKASLKAAHWVIKPETGTYDEESIRQRHGELSHSGVPVADPHLLRDVEAVGSRLQHPVGGQVTPAHTNEKVTASKTEESTPTAEKECTILDKDNTTIEVPKKTIRKVPFKRKPAVDESAQTLLLTVIVIVL
uniref:DUF4218 domain-containing protein n=1 Tax=Tanacetum cinerariifolium TaxID=118510 RepID=A0A6L2N025_TANCI|nr:hypothetical protein [Tanacetum cinerariifolium]